MTKVNYGLLINGLSNKIRLATQKKALADASIFMVVIHINSDLKLLNSSELTSEAESQNISLKMKVNQMI